jgi:hypothetical protein
VLISINILWKLYKARLFLYLLVTLQIRKWKRNRKYTSPTIGSPKLKLVIERLCSDFIMMSYYQSIKLISFMSTFNNNFQRNMLLQPKIIKTVNKGHASHINLTYCIKCNVYRRAMDIIFNAYIFLNNLF